MAYMWQINVHGNYYYMVEGNLHVWLTCGSQVAINMHSNNYYIMGGDLTCGN